MGGHWHIFLNSFFMAVVQNTLIGRSSGSVGATTMQKWKRLNVLRSKPSIQYQPNTPAQVDQRIRFGGCSDFYIQNMSVLKPVFDRLAGGASAFNTFITKNIGCWNQGDPKIAIDKMAKLFLGKGHLTEYADASCYWSFVPYWGFTSIVYSGVDWKNTDYYTIVIIYNYTTGQSYCEQVYNWNGRNAVLSDIIGVDGELVVAWSVSYSVKYGKFSNTQFVVGQRIPEF